MTAAVPPDTTRGPRVAWPTQDHEPGVDDLATGRVLFRAHDNLRSVENLLELEAQDPWVEAALAERPARAAASDRSPQPASPRRSSHGSGSNPVGHPNPLPVPPRVCTPW